MPKLKIFAGPCAVEDKEQIKSISECLKGLGLSWMRACVYKPRLSPHSFQGLGDAGFDIVKNSGLKLITEVLEASQIEKVMKYCDCIQIGTRNMTNYALLKEISKYNFPVLYKRGMAATISEWLNSVEYLTANGNDNIMLCERGIRTFEDATRFTLDIAAVPIVHKQSKYPICVDISHAAGRSDLVPSLAFAAAAAGADALMIEFHPNPMKALSDGPQQLNIAQFTKLIEDLKARGYELE